MAPDLPIMFIISCAHTFKISHYTTADHVENYFFGPIYKE